MNDSCCSKYWSKVMNLKEIIYFNNQKESILIKEKNNNQKYKNETLEK